MVNSDTEADRVVSADLSIDERGEGGKVSVRPVAQDWADAARRAFGSKLARPDFRVEWAWTDADEEAWPGPDAAEAPPWADVIVETRGTLVRVRFEPGDGGAPEATRFEVVAEPAVNARLLRRAGYGSTLDAAERAFQTLRLRRRFGPSWSAEVRQPGRAGRPDAFYADAARRYVDALATDSRAPIQRLLEEDAAQGHHATADEWRARLRRARERGLLTKAPPGRAGGELTAKAKRVLRDAGLTEKE